MQALAADPTANALGAAKTGPDLLSSAPGYPLRILTLITGSDTLDEAEALASEIRTFNAGIDFRLRFLDIEIEDVFCAEAETAEALEARLKDTKIVRSRGETPLEMAAGLALLLESERPHLLVITGHGALMDPAVAAAVVGPTRFAFFGRVRGEHKDALNLGEDAAIAVERMTLMAREID